jgi:hypothetical protein
VDQVWIHFDGYYFRGDFEQRRGESALSGTDFDGDRSVVAWEARASLAGDAVQNRSAGKEMLSEAAPHLSQRSVSFSLAPDVD